MVAAYSAASADHSRIAVQVDPDAHRDKGEIQLVFGWLRTLAGNR